jgi:hypothetical protein
MHVRDLAEGHVQALERLARGHSVLEEVWAIEAVSGRTIAYHFVDSVRVTSRRASPTPRLLPRSSDGPPTGVWRKYLPMPGAGNKRIRTATPDPGARRWRIDLAEAHGWPGANWESKSGNIFRLRELICRPLCACLVSPFVLWQFKKLPESATKSRRAARA